MKYQRRSGRENPLIPYFYDVTWLIFKTFCPVTSLRNSAGSCGMVGPVVCKILVGIHSMIVYSVDYRNFYMSLNQLNFFPICSIVTCMAPRTSKTIHFKSLSLWPMCVFKLILFIIPFSSFSYIL